jgi:molybdenum-dependent DNA-binding transcriptional regulator ModE
MNDPRHVLTPEALTMMVAIARNGSFAAAARQLGKVPSALTYSVRQLEDALDVLLFDRRSRQAKLTAAGQELLDEGGTCWSRSTPWPIASSAWPPAGRRSWSSPSTT